MATLIIAVVYLAAMAIFNVIADSRLLAEIDTQLTDSLGDVIRGATFASAVTPDGADRDVRSAPVLIWRVSPSGRSQAASALTLRFPGAAWLRAGRPDTVKLGAADFRVEAVADGRDWLVAGQSLASTQHVQTVLLTAQAVAGPLLLAAVFFGTLVVGLMASGPVEQARRRQLEFTADASHELRTPLSVIEAETGLALSATRDATQYQTALRRVSQESRRLRRIVDDLLWLARFDSQPANPANEPVDVSTIAGICADRFSGLARLKGIELTVGSEGEAQAWITAPPEWIDRLTGVLVDNACRYAAGREGAGREGAGRAPAVRITVGSHGSRVTLTVEDSGPGIPEEERARLFDRFYRVRTGDDGGSGLGLAIADAVVRSTGGRWRVDDSSLGGARMQVTWHRSTHRTGPHRRVTLPRAESSPATAPPGSATAAPAASRRRGSR
ncbi:MAG TPA: HAMP domain-containing sensor histidine kinase [Streptosporangiaceae bacterium]|nr:HAMP domain-containing sensor histidine kinase [Streptosporangiaceae bacterium]